MATPLQYPCLENPMELGGVQSMGSQRVRHGWATSSLHITGREYSPTLQLKIGLKMYCGWPHPSEQDPVFPTVSLSHQEGSISLLSLSLSGQKEWKPQSQKTNHQTYLFLFISLFVLLMVSFAVQKLLSLIRLHLFIFAFISVAWKGRVKDMWLRPMLKSELPVLF